MRSKLLGRMTKWGYRTPFRSNKNRMRNMETVAWHDEVLDELAEENEERELEAYLADLDAKRTEQLKWMQDIIDKT